jgi:hypothetical protein
MPARARKVQDVTADSVLFVRMRPPPGLPEMEGAASVGVRDLSLSVAGAAPDGVNFTPWLHWLRYRWVARSLAGRTRMLFDLWRHIEPFMRPDRRPLRNSEMISAYGLCKTTQIRKTRAPIIQRRALGSWAHFQSFISPQLARCSVWPPERVEQASSHGEKHDGLPDGSSTRVCHKFPIGQGTERSSPSFPFDL